MDGRQESSIGSGPFFQLWEVTTAMATIAAKNTCARMACKMPESCGKACVMAFAPNIPSRMPAPRAIQPSWLRSPMRQDEHQNHGYTTSHVMPELEGRDLMEPPPGGYGNGSLETGDDGARRDGE